MLLAVSWKFRLAVAYWAVVVNTLGAPIDGKGPLDHDGFSAVEAIAPGVIERQSVDQPVQTGYKAVDFHDPNRSWSA